MHGKELREEDSTRRSGTGRGTGLRRGEDGCILAENVFKDIHLTSFLVLLKISVHMLK